MPSSATIVCTHIDDAVKATLRELQTALCAKEYYDAERLAGIVRTLAQART